MLIRADDVTLRRGSFTLRASASFGEGVHLVSGPVGSGKSTLAAILASLEKTERGSVHREGVGSSLLSLQFPEYHVTCGTVAGEVRSWGLDPGEILPRARLAGREESDPLMLSRGELKRLTLACAFAKDPDLLLLDEPFSSLDCAAKVRACRAIEERQSGITIIFSHERSILPRVRTISEMETGRLISCGEVPGAIPLWRSAPPYLRYALTLGAQPSNITLTRCQGGAMQDPRLRILVTVVLSIAAFASVTGAVAALIWWLLFTPRWRALPHPRVLAGVIVMIGASAALSGFSGGDGLSYLIRMTVILLIAAWAYADRQDGELLEVSVWLLGDGIGFDIGLIAEMGLQSLRIIEQDITQITRAMAIKGMRPSIGTLAPLTTNIIINQLRRTEETAKLLTVRGYRNGGHIHPRFEPDRREAARAFFAVFIAICAFIPVRDVFIVVQ